MRHMFWTMPKCENITFSNDFEMSNICHAVDNALLMLHITFIECFRATHPHFVCKPVATCSLYFRLIDKIIVLKPAQQPATNVKFVGLQYNAFHVVVNLFGICALNVH